MDESSILKEQFMNAPVEVKKLLRGSEWSVVLEEIARKNDISMEEFDSFENETLFILLGMDLISNYQNNLRQNLNLTEEKSESLAKEVYEKLFKDVEQLLPTSIEGEPPKTGTGASSVSETPPKNLPVLEPDFAKETLMVKLEEKAHEVSHVEIPNPKKQETSNIQIPKEGKPQTNAVQPVMPSQPTKSSYQGGQDPYREPLG